MKRFTLLILLFVSINAWGQPAWQLKSKIEAGYPGFLMEGVIGKYPITMYLQQDKFCDMGYSNKWNYTHLLKGWYYYNNKKIKLPLTGYEKYFNTDSGYGQRTALYVPMNILDTIGEETSCELEQYKEIFITENDTQGGLHSLQNMQWKPAGKESFLPVKLKKVQSPSFETKATIALEVRGIEMFSFNLTDNLSNLKDSYGQPYNSYIDGVEILAAKNIGNDFYLIFSFQHPSVPGSIGFGHCGAGYEDYLGFLHISSLETKEFKYYQTDSCLGLIEESYTYDGHFPEKGIQKSVN